MVQAYDQGRRPWLLSFVRLSASDRFSFLQFQKFFKQPCIKFLGHTISYAMFIVLIISSSLLFASAFQGPMKRLSLIYPNITLGLNQSILLCQTTFNGSCAVYPPDDDFIFRHSSPTWIDIAITVFVIGERHVGGSLYSRQKMDFFFFFFRISLA